MGLSPGADLAPGLVEGAGRMLVAARVQVAEIQGEADEEPQLLDAEVGTCQVGFPFPCVGRLDEGFVRTLPRVKPLRGSFAALRPFGWTS